MSSPNTVVEWLTLALNLGGPGLISQPEDQLP
jgi:hypothetical protein